VSIERKHSILDNIPHRGICFRAMGVASRTALDVIPGHEARFSEGVLEIKN
jgi:hypothetical protein